MALTASEIRLKKLLKAAVVEVLEERQDLVRDALADAVEDIGLVKAILSPHPDSLGRGRGVFPCQRACILSLANSSVSSVLLTRLVKIAHRSS